MRICLIGKYPPIQGGVSSQTYWTALELAKEGHEVHVVTNASEVEYNFRQLFLQQDYDHLELNTFRGSIDVHYTESFKNQSYIPWANPYSSKLFGLSLEVVEKFKCEIIFAWYFEPYGLVGAQVSKILDIPFVLKHAGSDIGRLSSNENLNAAYRWMLNQADSVITSRKLQNVIEAMGARSSSLKFLKSQRIHQSFKNTSFIFDISNYSSFLSDWYNHYPFEQNLYEDIINLNNKEIDYTKPTIGLYGKIGETKGSFDLLKSLLLLKKDGLEFNFISIACGWTPVLEKYFRYIINNKLLESSAWVLPAIPPWRIPSFLNKIDIACFLERDFPITFHGPIIPTEILASGSALVCSSEIAMKQTYKDNLLDGKNFTLIPDPKDHMLMKEKLKNLITDKEKIKYISKHGYYLWEHINNESNHSYTINDLFHNYENKNHY